MKTHLEPLLKPSIALDQSTENTSLLLSFIAMKQKRKRKKNQLLPQNMKNRLFSNMPQFL